MKNGEIKGVKTNKGFFSTGTVVNATNAWAKLINAMAEVPITIPIEPYKHQAIITQPMKSGQINPMVISFKHRDAYLTQTAHGGIVGGIGLKSMATI